MKHMGSMLAVFAGAAFVVAGCSRDSESLPAGSRSAPPGLSPLEQALSAGAPGENVDAVVNALVALVDAGELEAAEAGYFRAAAQAEPYARGAFAVVAAHHYTNAQWEALAKWAAVLAATNLPPDLRAQAFLWEVRAVEQLGDPSRIAGRVGAVIAALDDEYARRVVHGMRDLVVASGDAGAVDVFLRGLADAAVTRPEWTAYPLTVKQLLALASQDWAGAEVAFEGLVAAGALPEAGQALSRLVDAMQQAGASAEAETLVGRVVAGGVYPVDLQIVAARYWLQAAARTEDAPLIASRLVSLQEAGVPAGAMINLFQEHVYTVLKADKPECTSAMRALATQLEAALEDPDQQAAIRILRFDAAFLNDEFDEVLAILDTGIPGRTPEWHVMARNKTQAHQALAEGDLPQAISRFRQFMKDLELDPPQNALDPTTGLRHSLAMTQAFNARRIAELQTRLGDAEAARATYAESRGLYKAALAIAEPGSREQEYLQHELSSLPAE